MSNQKINKYLIFIFFFILIALISAYFIQYALGYQPCRLCIYERVPYFFSIFLLITILFIQKYQKGALLILSIVFLFSSFLSFYHFGIEQGLFEELSVCGNTNFSDSLSKEQVLEQLKKSTISCKNVDFKILGLSLASINSIFSLFLSAIFLRLFLNYGKN
tara:strand:- start:465 stop:947 length:483 start_codon:yes stop_codon:yes gene_type:complete